MGVRTVGHCTAALRFFFVKTLKRPYPVEEVPYPKRPRRLPIVLSQEEAVALINSAKNLYHRAMLMTLYSTGMRRAELCKLKVEDIDSKRMILHIRQGKGGKDRDVPLSPDSAGDPAGVLALDAAADVSVSGHGQRPPRRQADHVEGDLGSLCRGGQERGHHQARESASAAPQFRHAPDGERRGPAHGANCCWATPISSPPSIYLHLSERHLKAAGTPLDQAALAPLDQVKRSRRLKQG